MIQKICFIILFFISLKSYTQYNFEGQIAENVDGKTVYLSIIEDYRKLSRPYFEQIIKKTAVDSSGHFKFSGDNLSVDNRIYRIHVDECSDEVIKSNHFLGRCENSRSILFIANNRDTIAFPTSFADQVLCEIASTNPSSDAFLQIDVLKEEMAFDFFDFRSEASQKLNSKKWFNTFQDFGKNLNEPLAELYIFDFLSDKRNETYSHYLKDISKNDYYSNLSNRLEEKYPNTVFTKLYQTEIATDESLVSQSNSSDDWNWIRKKKNSLAKLTAQERKIVDGILGDKTNKEIAADLFISLSTVKTHINNLYKKLNVSSREEIKGLFA